MEIWEISLLLVSISVLILVAFLIPAIVQIRRSVRKVEDVTDNLDQRLPSILANVEEMTTDLSTIISTGRYQMDSLGNTVNQIKEVTNEVIGFEHKFKRQFKLPLAQSLITITAISKATQAFLAVLKKWDNNNSKH